MNEQAQLVLLAALVGGAMFVACQAVRRALDRRPARIERRLRDAFGCDMLAGDLVTSVPSAHWAERLDLAFERMVQRTGLAVAPRQVLAGVFLLGIGLSGGLILWRDDLALGILGLLIGTGAPIVFLLFMQARWRRRLREQLPAALSLLARGLRASLSLEQALTLVGDNGNQPLAGEFRACADQAGLGLPVPVALQTMARRFRLPELDVLVSLISLHRETGGNLALLLDRLAASTRQRNQFRDQVRAQTSLSRSTAIFIGGVAPALMLYYLVFRPDYVVRFLSSPIGLTSVLVALALEVIGTLWLIWLLRIDY